MIAIYFGNKTIFKTKSRYIVQVKKYLRLFCLKTQNLGIYSPNRTLVLNPVNEHILLRVWNQ